MRYLSHTRRFMRDESGPTTVEYAVMLALVVAVVIVAVGLIGTKTKASLEDFDQKFNP